MEVRHGYPLEDWSQAKEEMQQVLIEVARLMKTICYGDLVKRIRTIQFHRMSKKLTYMLDEISSAKDGRGMLDALVVTQEKKRPGKGWLPAAGKRGCDISDPEKCWVIERDKVYAYWSNH